MSQKATQQEATIRDFLGVVFRRKFLILAVVFLTTGTVIFFNANEPQSYVSSSRIMVKRGERANIFTGGVRYLSWQEEMSSQMEIILSEEVFARSKEIFADSIKARGIRKPIRFNAGAVRVEVKGESNAFVVSYSGFDADECELGCAAITLAYAEYYLRKTAPPMLSDFFAEEIQDVVTDLAHWRSKKNVFLNKEKFMGMDHEGRFHLNKLTTLEVRLSSMNSRIMGQEIRTNSLADLVDLPYKELENQLSVAGSQGLQTGVMSTIKFGLQNLKIKREELLNKYTSRHPNVMAVDGQIRDLRLQLKQEVETVYTMERTALLEIRSQADLLRREIAETKAALSALPDKEMEFQRIENQIHMLQRKYDLLLNRQNEARIALASTPDWEITILSAPSVAWPRKTKDYVRIALGPFLSLVVGVGLAFFVESLDHSVKNAAEVEEYLDSHVLATISEFRGGV